jgi:hypothetical protein
MTVLLLCIGGMIAVIFAASILVLQQYRIKKGKVVLDEDYNGPAQVSVTLLVVIRFALKRSVYFRKFFMQYMFHIMVRIMHYIDMGSSTLQCETNHNKKSD